MKIQKNKTFKKDYSPLVDAITKSLGWSREEVIALYRDGRHAAPFLERDLPKVFPQLEHVDKKGYDHIDADGNRYDHKNFTQHGARYDPSYMRGASRKQDLPIAHAHACETIYIFADIVEFPMVRFIFKDGADLINEYPKCSISFKKREVLFG